MNRKELSIEYSRIYDEANKIFKKYNPCQFKGNECNRNRYWNERQIHKEKNGCCYDCSSIGPKGCKIKSISCKLFTCHIVRENYKQCEIEIAQLRKLTYKLFGSIPCGMSKSTLFYNCIAKDLERMGD